MDEQDIRNLLFDALRLLSKASRNHTSKISIDCFPDGTITVQDSLTEKLVGDDLKDTFSIVRLARCICPTIVK